VFPVFNNVDEVEHFDLVCKYARGHVPRTLDSFDAESQRIIDLFGTQEYLHSPSEYPSGRFPHPGWASSPEIVSMIGRSSEAKAANTINTECTQPPVYYALAGAWLDLGRAVGVREGVLPYWIRFMNALSLALIVWLGYLFGRRLRPDDAYMRFGIPILLAFFPQDVFYSISPDALSPLLFGASLYCLLLIHAGRKSYPFHTLAGILIAATVLTKWSNIGILGVLAIVIALQVRKSRGSGDLGRLAVMALAAVIPIAVWMTRNYLVLGEVTGSAALAETIGWVRKPFAEMWNHPIFTPSGFAVFWTGLMKSFWRGEFTWHQVRLASSGMDWFYVISTTVFLLASAVGLLRAKRDDPGRPVLSLGFAALGLCAAFLVCISIAYDFGECLYPSNECPYLDSGRLALGALIPLAALYVNGIGIILSKLRLAKARLGAVMVIAALITLSELAISRPAFRSEYNLIHIIRPSGQAETSQTATTGTR